MKDCGEIRENISLYIDDELGAEERRAFEEHIAGCEACKRELADISEVVSLCRDTEEEELPVDFRQKLHERLVNEAGTGKVTPIGAGVSKAAKRTRSIRYVTSIAAGILLILLAGAFYNLGMFNSLNTGGKTSNSSPQQQASLADAAKPEAPAAQAQGKQAPSEQAPLSANDEVMSVAAAPSSETNRSAASNDREIQFAKDIAADTDVIMSSNTELTITVDDPAAQLDILKTLALKNNGEEQVKAATFGAADGEVMLMAKAPSDEIEIAYKIPSESFKDFTKALDTQYGQANIQPGPVISEDVTSKVNELIKKSDSLESQIKQLEDANEAKNAAQLEQLKADKANTDAQIEQLRLDSDFTSITLIIKKK